MCAIAGFFELDTTQRSGGSVSPRSRMHAMLQTLRHRGPDDWGMAFFGVDPEHRPGDEEHVWSCPSSPSRLVLGHRRLSIIDLSTRARQPMASHDDSSFITFNGEIYNYIELREELRQTGAVFHTNSDTEVLLEAYRHWGVNMLSRLDGMFAFALWDIQQQKLLCARDPFTIKPFYFGSNGSRFVFASEPRAVLLGLEEAGRVDAAHLAEWLVIGVSDHDEGTFYREVKQLRGGEWLEVGPNQQPGRPKSFWQPPSEIDDQTPDAPHLVRELVELAIKRQLRSDVPVGGCLSGGLDSAAVMATVARQLGPAASQFKALTCSNQGFERDETSNARLIAARAGIEWHGVHVSLEDMPNELERLVHIMGEPFSGWSMFASFNVMKKARELGLKVMLNGQGGDEIFLGYPRTARKVLGDIRRAQGLGPMFGEWLSMRRNMQETFRHWLTANFYFSNPGFAVWRGRRRIKGVVSPEVLEHVRPEVAEFVFNRNGTHESQLLDLTRGILPRLLRFEDRNSMAFSLELRVPMLALPLAEAGLRLPLNWRVRNGYAKYALRVAMEDRLPPEITWHRQKRGFEVPEAEWTRAIRPYLGEWLMDLPKDSPFNPALMLEMIDDGRGYSQWFWRIISTALWIRSSGVKF